MYVFFNGLKKSKTNLVICYNYNIKKLFYKRNSLFFLELKQLLHFLDEKSSTVYDKS